jgi:chromosome partitioning protein
MIIISVSNQKGGVGKTTLSLQLGHWLSSKGHKTLLVDADPQRNLSKSLVETPSFGLYEALTGSEYEIEEARPNLFLLSGSERLSGLEKSLIGELDAYVRLKELFNDERFFAYEIALIDTPPSLGVLTANALAAALYVLVPLTASVYSMEGTNDLMSTVSKVRKNINPSLTFLGVVINAFDSVPSITKEIRKEILETFHEKVFRTALSKSIKIEEAIAAKSALGELKSVGKKCRAVEEIKGIGEELLFRLGVL